MFLGTTHFHECPVQPNLPIYITVIGATGLFSLLLMYLRNTLDDCLLARFCSVFSLMLCVFIVCWFFAGEGKRCYIFGSLGQNYYQSSKYFYLYINNSEPKVNDCYMLFFQVPTGFTPYILPVMTPPVLEFTVIEPCTCLHFGSTIYAFCVCP